jgi:thiamine phosphate synthase YjbQ (UPF0047 family)
MVNGVFQTTLEISPRSRYDAIDVGARIAETYGDVLEAFKRVLYCSHHTTAGYLDQRLAHRLHDRRDGVDPYMRKFQALFPLGAGYRHDELEMRSELNDEERRAEPPNGDAHLTFIGSGLQSCVTYDHRTGVPVFFMDLDGVYRGKARCRQTSIVAYDVEETVAEGCVEVPVSRHAIDSVNLADERIGLRQQIDELLSAHPIQNGRLDISLDPAEQAAGVTVNEYETLLMRYDLTDVLDNPLRFVARQGRRMLSNPRAVPAKTLGYARYDMVRVINRLIDVTGLSDTAIVAFLTRLMAIPASRRLRFKRSLSLPVTMDSEGHGQIVAGRYQSPILIQWAPAPRQMRNLHLRLSRFS